MYTSKNVVKNGASVVVGASETNTVLTGQGPMDSFPIIWPTCWTADIVCSGVTVTNAVTLKLQTRFSNAQSWIDSKTVSVTGNGTFSIRLLDTVAGDASFLPLRTQGRIVVTTGVSDAVTVSAVYVPSFS